MSSAVIDVQDGQTPVHLAFADTDDVLAALLPDGSIEAWRCSFSKGNKSKVTSLGRHKILHHDTRSFARQLAIVVRGNAIHAVLLLKSGDDSHDQTLEVTFSLSEDSKEPTRSEIEKSRHPLYSVFVYKSTVYAQTVQGHILSTDGQEVVKLPEACPLIQGVAEAVFLGLSDTSKLYANNKLVASSCSSFAIAGDFLVYTTLQHEARFVLLDNLIQSSQDGAPVVDYSHTLPKPGETHIAEGETAERTAKYARRVERGARIVTVVPSSMLVVLQMPRGNLETIAPRPLVLQVVRAHLDAKQYREAFLVCRRHRIDLNVLCDHDRNAFLNDLDLFVDQIENIDYLNLFVSGLKNENITQTMYASLTPERASVATK
jgi:elongator complex protein 1